MSVFLSLLLYVGFLSTVLLSSFFHASFDRIYTASLSQGLSLALFIHFYVFVYLSTLLFYNLLFYNCLCVSFLSPSMIFSVTYKVFLFCLSKYISFLSIFLVAAISRVFKAAQKILHWLKNKNDNFSFNAEVTSGTIHRNIFSYCNSKLRFNGFKLRLVN